MNSFARIAAASTGITVGLGIMIAAAPADTEITVEPAPVVEVVPPVTSEVDGSLELETSSPEVSPAPELAPEVSVTPAPPTPVVEDTVPVAPVPDEDAYLEPPTAPGSSWHGLLVGDVIVCPPGYEVSIDVTPAGTVWAACM